MSAHRIAVTGEELEFELACLLTTLDLEKHGGPRAINERDKEKYFHLVEKGWVQMAVRSIPCRLKGGLSSHSHLDPPQ